MMYSREVFGKVIKYIRKTQLKIGQEEMSKKICISQSALSKIENGSLEMGAPALLVFFETFNIAPNDFKDLIDKYVKETASLNNQNDKSVDHFEILRRLA